MFGKWFGKRSKRDAGPGSASPGQPLDIDPVAVDPVRIGGVPELAWLFIDIPGPDIQRALDAWGWIGLKGFTAIAVSAFGDVFFRHSNQSIWMLDTIEGRLNSVAQSLAGLTARLQEVGDRDELLLGGMVVAAREKGICLAAGECYDFAVAPVLGGAVSLDAMHSISFVVKVHIMGQLHEQICDLPDGTRISGFSVTD